MHSLARYLCRLLLLVALPVLARDYRFDGSMSEEVLRSYLSRSMTTMYLLTGHGDFDDNLRMLTNCGVKFAGRAVYQWGREEGGAPAIAKETGTGEEECRPDSCGGSGADSPGLHFRNRFARRGRIWRCRRGLSKRWAGPSEPRNFRYEEMIYPSGRFSNQWGQGASVPDVSRSETKLWFYFLARSYIDAGCEAIHYGQVELMNRNDPKLDHWAEVLALARSYAAKNARRHFLLCDAHVPGGGLVREGKLLLDFHSFPLRIEEVADKPKEAQLRVGYTDAIYGRSRGGITPSGWRCEHLPYLVEFDNYGRSRKPGEAGQGKFWVWGWDEITWFSQQPEQSRNEWLRYAWRWVREHDPEGYVQMPGMRCLSGAADGKRWYDVNKPSTSTPNGFGQEEAIRAIWASDGSSPLSNQ